ncbi:hypothetical protein DENIS_4601 [Desulfonema ishimotonii]|uniref:Uncharacterized protein n=1 Tax=Desulfonema ishimotonii TaxID=45657 RepID=A0A401G340_9BACT|nr:hypothetical protein DENIS_4601 [Desulfonema ishimotonii]
MLDMRPGRENFLWYTDSPFYLAKPNFIVKSHNSLKKISSVDDVKGYVVGQFNHAANSEFIMNNQAHFRFDRLAAGTTLFEQQLRKLIIGRLDAIHTLDEYTLLYEAKRLKIESQVKILLLPDSPFPFYSAFCKNNKGEILVKKFNAAFHEAGFEPEDYKKLIHYEFEMLSRQQHK